MKVAQPQTPSAPLPERKPEPAAPPQATGFRSALVEAQAPVPARKPEAPVALASGQSLPPLPAHKPSMTAEAAPLPGRKPTVTADAAPLPERKPDPPQTPPPAQVAATVPRPGVKPEPPAATSQRLAAQQPAAETAAGRIILASQQVAGLSGHSFTAILAQATQESGLDPRAKSRTSSAAGPFQFLERTWLGLFRRHASAYGLGSLADQIQMRDGVPMVKDPATRQRILDLRHDVDVAAGMAARYLAEGRERLSASLKRPVTEVESRIAYVMGVGGAAKLIRAAEARSPTPAAELLPAAAKANGPLFYDRASGRALSAGETVARLAQRMESDQRELFAAIDRAGRTRLDGAPSPLNPFQTADTAPDTAANPLG